MKEFYLQIRVVHIASVTVSGLLFLLRATAHNFLGAAWAMALPLRIAAYTVDTVLLTAALMLMTIVRQYPFIDAWLTAKVLLLAVYIAFGWLALRAPRRSTRLWSMGGAVAVFLFIVSVARAHDALGVFSTI